jgi:hypothetical protein
MKPIKYILAVLSTMLLNNVYSKPVISRVASSVNNSYVIYVCIILVILGGLSVVVYVMFKKDSTIQDSNSDPIWNSKFLNDYSDDVFYLMQEAWKSRDLSPVRHLMTDQMISDYQAHFDLMRQNGEVNVIKLIEIHQIQIIPDHQGNESAHLSYTAIVDGSMVDAGFNEFTGEAVYNGDLELDYFKDFYHFIRVEDRWILEFIDKSNLEHKIIGFNMHTE